MSVTVADLLRLPSLRQAKVVGGHQGLGKIVASISVLESTDPEVLISDIFPKGEFYGSEIVITGFLNIVDDVDRQCANIQRLAAGGEVGLILFYVGAFLPRIDQRLIDLANELDFVLICMPEKQKSLRYSEVISDVMECIYRDRARNESIVSDILARVSALPSHQRTVNTILKMLSDRLSASLILCDSAFHILNLISWPRGLEEEIKAGLEALPAYPSSGASAPCAFWPESSLYRQSVQADRQRLELLLLKEGDTLPAAYLEQALEVIRLGVNIWGENHGEIAIHELIRAILQDDPIKMRRLADIFHIDVASIHEMWILSGDAPDSPAWLQGQADAIQQALLGCADTAIADCYEGRLLLFLSTPPSLREAEKHIQAILSEARAFDGTMTLARYCDLQDTGEVRQAYLCHQTYLQDARLLFPHRAHFTQGETEFAQRCRTLIGQGEAAVAACLAPLRSILRGGEDAALLDTLVIYLLDGGASVTETAALLYLHKNTVKYRLQRISDCLGCRPDKMPESALFYRAAAVYRLLHGAHPVSPQS